MASKKRLLKGWKIYAILDDSNFLDTRGLLTRFNSLLGHVDALQLRSADPTSSRLYGLAVRMSVLARRVGVPFLVNDRPELALSIGSSGVHLGKGDMPVSRARELLGPDAIIGRTIREGDDPALQEAEGADYLSIGPIFSTPIKPGLKPVSGRALRRLASFVRVPLVGIGGIDPSNVQYVTGSGIRCVAFLRYAIRDKNMVKMIDQLREAMR